MANSLSLHPALTCRKEVCTDMQLLSQTLIPRSTTTWTTLVALCALTLAAGCAQPNPDGNTGQTTDTETETETEETKPSEPPPAVPVFREFPDGVVYVASAVENEIVMFGRASLDRWEDPVPAGHQPQGIAVSPTTSTVYFINQFLPLEEIKATTPSGKTPDQFRSASFWGVDPSRGNRFQQKAAIGESKDQPNPSYVSIHPSGNWLAISEPSLNLVYFKDLGSGERKRNAQLEAGTGPLGSAFSTDGKWFAYCNTGGTVAAVNLSNMDQGPIIEGEIAFDGGQPQHVVIGPDTTTAYVTVQGLNQVAAIDLPTREVAGTWDLPGAPAGIARTEDGSHYFVALNDTNQIVKLDGATGEVVGSVETEKGPTQLVVDEDFNRVWATNTGASTVSIITIEPFALERNKHIGQTPTGIALLKNPDKGPRIMVSGQDAAMQLESNELEAEASGGE